MNRLFYTSTTNFYRFVILKRNSFLLTCIMLLLLSPGGYGQPFITTWKTDNTGTSGPTSITIPTYHLYTYNYDVDWNNDGSYESLNVEGDITHNYEVAGVYTVRIRGKFPAIYFNNTGDKSKIIGLEQWGNLEWGTMANAFYGTNNLRLNAHDVPDLSRVSSLINMFREASSFNSDLGLWDVSNVIAMKGMLTNTGLSIVNYDKTLIGWASQGITDLELGAHNLVFCQGDAARNHLVSNLGWTINGDSYNCSSLPIILLTFSTSLTNNNEILLKWETASEVNNLGFEVKKSTDCKCWSVIGYVDGYGTKDINSHYRFVDKNPIPGINYYVLRQMDRNNDDTYSDIRSVNVVVKDEVRIFPNPTNGRIKVIGEDIAAIKIINRTGQLLKTHRMTSPYIDLSDLPGGMYIVAIHTSHMILYKRVVKN